MSNLVDMIRREISRALAVLRPPFRGVLGACDSGGGVAAVQASGVAGETVQAAELFQHFGLTSNPPAGSRVIALPLGGKTSHVVVVATEHDGLRKAGLAPGEVAIYNSRGDFVHLKADGTMEISCATLAIVASDQIVVDSPVITCTGRVEFQRGFDVSGQGGAAQAATLKGDLKVVDGDVSADGVSLQSHVHGGVVQGSAQTGPPEA